MNEILNRIATQIENMNSKAKKLIKYGFLSFLIVDFGCLCFIILNKLYWGNSEHVTKGILDVFKSSFSVVLITLIGGIIMDHLAKEIEQ